MLKNEIIQKLDKMNEEESICFGRIKVSKVLDYVEKGHGLSNMQHRNYKFLVEIGNESDQDYDYNTYSCHNDSDIERCVNVILSGKFN